MADRGNEGDAGSDEIRYSELLKGREMPAGAEEADLAEDRLRISEVRLADEELSQGPVYNPRGDEFLAGLEKERESFSHLHAELCRYLTNVFGQVHRGDHLSIDEAFEFVEQLVKNPRAFNALIYKGIKTPAGEEFLTPHSINVAVIAIKTGADLRYDRRRLTELGVAALLHDVGMATLPKELLLAPRKLSPGELRVLQEHPGRGRDLISRHGEKYQWLAEAVFQHHEREDGTGYPRGLKGDEIHEFAKIVGLADVYEAMTHERPHKKAIIPFYTVKQILEMRRGLFPTRLIKALVTHLTVFPLFSYVRLNTGAIGQVVDTSGERPMKPIIVIKYDSDGQALPEPKVVDLAEMPLLYVVDSVELDE